MANTKSPKEMEAAALAMVAKEAELELDPQNRDNFNIQEGYALPEGFINPPLSKEDVENRDHLCIDRAGNYQKSWFQLLIEKMYDKQQDPVDFPLGTLYQVPLDEWVDAPPEVIESLKSAVETHHEQNVKPGDVELGKHAVHKETKRRRFVWRSIPSA